MSHDLRTPLATIRAAAGTMLDPYVQLTDDDRRASALAIDQEAEHLNRLVTNLLDLSRIEAGSLRADVEPIELDDIVEPALRRLGKRLAGRSLEVDLGASAPAVLADPVFIDQIVANLLENAAKYVPDGAARADRRHGDRRSGSADRRGLRARRAGGGAAAALREVLSRDRAAQRSHGRAPGSASPSSVA